MLRSLLGVAVVLTVAAFFAIGCDSPPSGTEQPSADATDATTSHDHGSDDRSEERYGSHSADEHDHGTAEGNPMAKMRAELAKLPPEDAASAEKQHICPVSGEMLGTMGAPIKMDVKGQQVWICCEGCREQLEENPDKYLAQLKD